MSNRHRLDEEFSNEKTFQPKVSTLYMLKSLSGNSFNVATQAWANGGLIMRIHCQATEKRVGRDFGFHFVLLCTFSSSSSGVSTKHTSICLETFLRLSSSFVWVETLRGSTMLRFDFRHVKDDFVNMRRTLQSTSLPTRKSSQSSSSETIQADDGDTKLAAGATAAGNDSFCVVASR